MTHVLGMMKKGCLSELLSLEASVNRPPENIIQKVQNLSGLLDSQYVPSWRTLDKTPLKHPAQKRREIESRSRYESGSIKNYSQLPNWSENSTRNSVKYVSKYKNNESQVEDKILNTIILSKLNKFSDSTYNDIRDFLYQVLGSSNDLKDTTTLKEAEEFVKDFVKLVFKKATSEEIFCPLYAKLLGEASAKYPIVLNEMNKLHENYMNIFHNDDDVSSVDYNSFVSKNIEKKYRLGYSQFISELTLLHILSTDKIVNIFEIIFKQILIQGKLPNRNSLNEEYIDCLLRIAKVLKGKQDPFFVEIRKMLLSIVKEPIDMIQQNKDLYTSISNKSRFLILNINDYLQ